MRHIIIGAGAAGISAAGEIRRLRPEDEIVVVSKDDQVHSRCMLHKFLSGERTAQGINFVPEDFFENNRIQWIFGRSMTGLDCAGKRALFDGDSYLEYDRLLIATGAYYLVPPIPGFRESENVYGFRDLCDAQAIDRAAEKGSKAVIVGSGLVGMDAAYALMERGIKPAVVEMADRILPLQLDSGAAAEYQQRFEAHGCRFFLSAKAADTRRDGEGRITAVVLDDGTELECDFVIVAAGVRPEVRFLQNCGVQVDRSIQVDEYLRTTVPDVYAAGDVCGLSGIWPNAMKQGITAARNMCGQSERYEDTYAMKNTMNFFGLPALCLGDINRVGADTQVITQEDSRVYRKALVENGLLKAILMLGDISASGIFQYLIKNEVPLPCCDRDIFRLTFADFYGFDKESGKYLWNVG